MSKGEVLAVHNAPAAAASSQYLHWLQRERRTRLIIRTAQIAILMVFLVLWEILPRASSWRSSVRAVAARARSCR